ncbi:MAG: tetratricopeptide repeat protein [Deltaproteobacteria bacterium]|nr:tetratricopeptide repeat protein [Deltaproteobacteria bacterium]
MKSRTTIVGVLAIGSFLALPGMAGKARARSLEAIQSELTELKASLDQYLQVMQVPHAKTSREITKRLLDGIILFRMKDYDKAASVFTDLVTNYRTSREYLQAEFYLAESLFMRREYHSAARHFQVVVDRQVPRFYQKALQRLLEIAFKTGRSDGVYKLVEAVQQVPASQRDPAMAYILGKYYYFRGLYDRAWSVMNSIPATGQYGLRAQYFLGVIAVQKKETKKARGIFATLLKRFDSMGRKADRLKGRQRKLADLTTLALARLYYTNDRPDDAINLYRTISRRSAYFEEALHELAWAYLRAWEFYRAIHTLELLMVLDPNSRYVSESKLMIANLRVVARRYESARKLFRQTTRRYRPIYLKLRALRRRHMVASRYLALLVKRDQGALDVDFQLPSEVVKDLRRQSQVRKALRVLGDLRSVRAGIKECERLYHRVARRLNSSSRISAFPELAKGRAHAVEVDMRLTRIRQDLMAQFKGQVMPNATGAERAQLTAIHQKKARLEKLIAGMPTSGAAFAQRVAAIRKMYDAKNARAHKLQIHVDALEATLAAVKNYYESTRAQQKLSAASVEAKVKKLSAEIGGLRDKLRSIQSEIDDGRMSAGVDDATMAQERKVRREYQALLAAERVVLNAIQARMGSGARGQAAAVESILAQATAVRRALDEYNRRIDAMLAFKLGHTRRILDEERANIATYKRLAAEYGPDAKDVAGGVTEAGFQKAARGLYGLLLRADIGILDVAWALKSDESDVWVKNVRRQSKQLQRLDERFQEVRRR